MAEWQEQWQERVGGFAAACGKELDAVAEALKEVVGEPGEQALDILSDETSSPTADIKEALKELKIPSGVFNKNLATLRGPKKELQLTGTSGAGVEAGLVVLPALPDQESFVKALKTGGELKIGEVEVLAAVKAALANKVGLYDLPEKIRDAMEAFSESIEEPSPTQYYELRKLIAQRNYAEVLSAMNVEGHYITAKRKERLFTRLDSGLWESLYSFNQQLVGWRDQYMAGMANPAAMMAALTGGQILQGMMQPPETAPLHDSAEAVVNRINKVFAGDGIVVAKALAYDAENIKKVLDDQRLPATVGAVNKEQMLKMLKVDVTADYVRLEQNLARFTLAILRFDKVTSGQEELMYVVAMMQLGIQIQWEKLMRMKPENGTAGPKRDGSPGGGPRF